MRFMGAVQKTFLLVCLLGLCVQAGRAEPVKDLPGWTNTRWGMTLAQLRKVHPEMTIGVDYSGFTAGRLPNVTIGDATLQVNLGFKNVGGQAKEGAADPPQSEWRLNRVELVGPEDACYRLTEALTAKYGQPSHNEPRFHLWVLPTTTVRQVISPVSVETDKCIIIYHATEKSDNL